MELEVAIITGIFALLAVVVPIFINHRLNRQNRNKEMTELNQVDFTATNEESNPEDIDHDSKYTICRISDIIKNEMRNRQLNVDGLEFKSDFSVTDLKIYTRKIYYPGSKYELIERVIDTAREKAYSIKYAKPREDEKLTDINKIKIDGLKHWEIYFWSLMEELNLKDFNEYQILDIGIGNGYSVQKIYQNAQNITGIDISKDALNYAKKILPGIKLIQNQAEDLRSIANGSIELVLSFRTFQSSFFDKRRVLCEIFRVLISGGFLILSVPVMFLKSDGTVLSGLIAHNQKNPTAEYADRVVDQIMELMDTLNYINIGVNKQSPFEYYIYGKRP